MKKKNQQLELTVNPDYKCKGNVGKLSFTDEAFCNSPFYIKKLEEAKATMKKYPKPTFLFRNV